MSAFSAIRLFLALRLTRVRLIAQVTTPLATIRMVAARTIHPPHAMCGTNSRMSTKKASSDTSSVGNVKINKARRYRGEWAGEWKCAATASEKHISVMRAATGWMIRIEESECRVAEGSENSEADVLAKRPSARCQYTSWSGGAYVDPTPVLYIPVS